MGPIVIPVLTQGCIMHYHCRSLGSKLLTNLKILCRGCLILSVLYDASLRPPEQIVWNRQNLSSIRSLKQVYDEAQQKLQDSNRHAKGTFLGNLDMSDGPLTETSPQKWTLAAESKWLAHFWKIIHNAPREKCDVRQKSIGALKEHSSGICQRTWDETEFALFVLETPSFGIYLTDVHPFCFYLVQSITRHFLRCNISFCQISFLERQWMQYS